MRFESQISLLASLGIMASYENVRLPEGEHEQDLYYYQCRHSEGDWAAPMTIEKGTVLVNFWGTIITRSPISFDDDGIYELSSEEGQAIMMLAMSQNHIGGIVNG